jgi:hypothetical protein
MDLTRALAAKDLGGGKTRSSWSTEVILVTAEDVILAIELAFENVEDCKGRKTAVNV